MSFVSSEMAAAAVETLPVLSQDGVAARCFICAMRSAHMCEAECSVSASDPSLLLLSANWCLRAMLDNIWEFMEGGLQELLSVTAPTVPLDQTKFVH